MAGQKKTISQQNKQAKDLNVNPKSIVEQTLSKDMYDQFKVILSQFSQRQTNSFSQPFKDENLSQTTNSQFLKTQSSCDSDTVTKKPKYKKNNIKEQNEIQVQVPENFQIYEQSDQELYQDTSINKQNQMYIKQNGQQMECVEEEITQNHKEKEQNKNLIVTLNGMQSPQIDYNVKQIAQNNKNVEQNILNIQQSNDQQLEKQQQIHQNEIPNKSDQENEINRDNEQSQYQPQLSINNLILKNSQNQDGEQKDQENKNPNLIITQL